MFSEDFERALDRLRAAQHGEETWRVVRAFYAEHGLPIINYSFIDGAQGGLEAAPVQMKSSADRDFIQHYLDNRLDLVDPVADYGRTGRSAPFIIGDGAEDTMAALSEDRRRHMAFVASTSHNVNLLVPLPEGQAAGPVRSGVVLGGRMGAKDFRTLLNHRGPELVVFAHHMHARLNGPVLRELDGAGALTARETDCLAYIARGDRPDRIGDALGVATVTVNYHLTRVREKLRARTTAEAVAKAIRYGLITP